MKIPIGEFESILYGQLNEFFSTFGYELIAEKKQFRKTIPFGYHNVIFLVTESHKETFIEVSFGIRNHQVEQIAQQFLTNYIDFWEDANTLIISIGKFKDIKYFGFKVKENEDLTEASLQIRDFFRLQGFPFMEQISDISSLEKILNHEPTKPCKFLYDQVHRIFKGVIAAKLVHHPNYLNIVNTYRNHLIMIGTAEDKHNFERMMSFLRYYSPN